MSVNSLTLCTNFEGRLFSNSGRLHLVLSVDHEAGLAEVSSRVEGQRQVVSMPVTELAAKLAQNLKLDGLNGQETAERVVQEAGGWFFPTREGPIGPYPTEVAAQQALRTHVIAAQAEASAR